MFGVKFIVSGKIFFHVGEEDGDVDNVVPACVGVFQHEPYVFKYGAALFFDVVTKDVTRDVQSDAGNLLAAAHARPDSGEEEQVTDTLGMWKCADRFGRTRAFERLAHRAACDDFVARALMNWSESEIQPNNVSAFKSEAS